MACCAALTLLFAGMYRILRWLGFRPTDDEFAPAATWPPVERPVAVAPPPTTREALGRALLAVGLAWFAAGMLAMHVFDLLPHITSILADIAFHGSGLWLATAGLALRFLPHPTVRTAA